MAKPYFHRKGSKYSTLLFDSCLELGRIKYQNIDGCFKKIKTSIHSNKQANFLQLKIDVLNNFHLHISWQDNDVAILRFVEVVMLETQLL